MSLLLYGGVRLHQGWMPHLADWIAAKIRETFSDVLRVEPGGPGELRCVMTNGAIQTAFLRDIEESVIDVYLPGEARLRLQNPFFTDCFASYR